MSVLFAGGDPGGSRAIMPVCQALAGLQVPCRILDHGFLGREAPPSMRSMLAAFPDGPLENGLLELGARALVFGSSLRDPLPLALARAAKGMGLPVAFVLDNWCNYALRLASDGLAPLIPDRYLVMDEFAKTAAIQDGVPEWIIRVTGHPNLARSAREIACGPLVSRAESARALGLFADRPILLFVSEPLRDVFGDDPDAPGSLGFTERDTFKALAGALRELAPDVHLALLPHPKQRMEEMEGLWREAAGGLSGGPLALAENRLALAGADGVAGIGSILLYEAWMTGLPTLSLQPGRSLDFFFRIAQLEGIHHARSWEDIPRVCAAWLEAAGKRRGVPRPEAALHASAPEAAARAVLELLR